MLGTIDRGQNWQWAAFGKHPAAQDYFRMGRDIQFFDGLFSWVEDGYRLLTMKENRTLDFCSWRFWARVGGEKETMVCGLVRVSSDSFGRAYPLVIAGTGFLRNWQENWDLLPFACEKTWCQIEYLASNHFPDLKKLEDELHTIRPPEQDWSKLKVKRESLNAIGSPLDPFASFLDLQELKKLAAANAEKSEVILSLDRGPCNDKIMRVSLWHLLFRETATGAPNILFVGGTLENGYLGMFRRPLKSADFMQIWSMSSVGVVKNTIGTEFSMDIAELGILPISADKPSGVDIRYDASFDELQTEVDKLSSPALAGSINWEKVCRFASDILMHKSKDLLVASFLAVALVHTRGNDGFAMGLRMYLDLMERFWIDLYPPRIRMRGRVRAVEWWAEKAETVLRQAGNLTFPPEQIIQIRGWLNKLDSFLAENLEHAPSLATIKEYFNDLPLPERKMEQEHSPAFVMYEGTSNPSTVSPSSLADISETDHIAPGISSRTEADSVLQDGLDRIRAAAFYLFQKDSALPHSYRLTRKAAWYGVEELPPSVNCRTRIPPPTTQEKNFLFDLRNRSDAQVLLNATEARLPQYIFWIDINRLSAEALSRLGSRFDKAHGAVCQETAFLLHRLPGLEELTFSDGTPFAAPETRQWLEGIIFRKGSPTPMELAPGDRADNAVTESVIGNSAEEIQLLMRKGNLLEALDAAQSRLRECCSKREKLLLRVTFAQMLVDAGKPKLSIPYLDQVLVEIDRYGLEDYDPQLATQALRLVWYALESQPEQKFRDRAVDVLHRIGRLDLPEMVRLTKG